MSPARRRMLQKRHHRIRLVILIGVLVALGACERRTAFFPSTGATDFPAAIGAEQARSNWVEFTHTAGFADGDTVLNDAEKAGLETFVRRLGRGEGVTVKIHASGLGADTVIAARREISTARHLINLGLHPKLGQTEIVSTGGTDTVTVTIGRTFHAPAKMRAGKTISLSMAEERDRDSLP